MVLTLLRISLIHMRDRKEKVGYPDEQQSDNKSLTSSVSRVLCGCLQHIIFDCCLQNQIILGSNIYSSTQKRMDLMKIFMLTDTPL